MANPVQALEHLIVNVAVQKITKSKEIMYSTQNFSGKAQSSILVFVDESLEDYKSLISNIKSDTKLFVLAKQEDGIKQITQVLSQNSNIESIHIVSHGKPGTLFLGNSQLSLDTLENYAGELQTWSKSAPHHVTPALVLYGCNVAAGDAGTEFLNKLYQLTNSTIYASSTKIGNSRLGGNWDLDVCKGEQLETFSLVFENTVLQTYSGVFATGSDSKYTYFTFKEEETGNVAFIDISSDSENKGTKITLPPNPPNRDSHTTIQLPFQFNLYGENFDSLTVGENGGIKFGVLPDNFKISSNNANLPSADPRFNYSIFPFWDDLDLSKSGDIYYKLENNKFIIQWDNVARNDSGSDNGTFQVVLHKDTNNIDFVYKDVDFGNTEYNFGKNATIGLNQNGNIGLKYSVNEAKLDGVKSIRFFTTPQIEKAEINLKEGDTVTLTSDNFKATDVDNDDNLSKIEFEISNLKNGEFRFKGKTTAITKFTQADINAKKVEFIHNGGEIAPSFEFKVTDGFNSSDAIIPEITFTNVNDAPKNSVPDSQTVNEDTKLELSGSNAISVSDVDAGQKNGEVEVQLSVDNGILNLATTQGISFDESNGNGKSKVTFKGKIPDINTALKSLSYLGNSNFNGEEILTITTNDLGNTGLDGPLSDTDTVKITVNPVNDPPQIKDVPPTQNVTADRVFVFSTANGNPIQVEDEDVNDNRGTKKLKVTLSVDEGILKLPDVTDIAVISGSNNSKIFTIEASLEAVNQALDGLTYQVTNQNFNGTATLTVEADDNGNYDTTAKAEKTTITVKINVPDTDGDGINDATESSVVKEITKNPNIEQAVKDLSQKAVSDDSVVALFSDDNGTTKPVLIAIDDEINQEFAIDVVGTNSFEDIKDPITAFNQDDPRKASLTNVTGVMDIIDFKVNSEKKLEAAKASTEAVEEPELVKLEVKLPEDTTVNAILLRDSEGKLYDFDRKLNPDRGKLDDELLTGAVLQDRNFNDIPDWAVLYLQEGKWGDGDALVAVNLDFGTSSVGVDENGLTFNGNRSYVEFSLKEFKGEKASEVGLARVRFGEDGTIIEVNGQAVSSAEEAKQAILEGGEILFSSLASGDKPDIGTQSRTIELGEGEKTVFFAIEDGTRDELLSKGLNSKPIKFSVPSLNSDGASIFTGTSNESGTETNFSLAGLFDIDAKILTPEQAKSQLKQLALPNNSPDGLIDLNSSGAFEGKQVKLTFSLQREAAYNNSVYIYKVEDGKGSILDPITGTRIDPNVQLNSDQQQRYLELATTQQLLKDVQFTTGNYSTTEVSITLDGGGYYLPFMVSNGTLSSIGQDYSRIFTSYMGVNSDGVDHIRSLGNGVYGFEDMIQGGDMDFDDMILSINNVEIMG